ncbi:MAG: CarD family transcriptional regulator [Eubacteriales bacterium]|nr:CarD family transcriptional regulator [Eubacteriales bacterium]
MYQVGEYIIYGYNGVCRVNDITHLDDISGADRTKQYYILSPLGNQGSVIYSPVNNTKVMSRPLITREEAQKLLETGAYMDRFQIPYDKLQEARYREIVGSCDCMQWLRLMKTLYFRKAEREAQGKKVTARDEKYLGITEQYLLTELSFVLQREKNDIKEELYTKFRKKNTVA